MVLKFNIVFPFYFIFTSPKSQGFKEDKKGRQITKDLNILYMFLSVRGRINPCRVFFFICPRSDHNPLNPFFFPVHIWGPILTFSFYFFLLILYWPDSDSFNTKCIKNNERTISRIVYQTMEIETKDLKYILF